MNSSKKQEKKEARKVINLSELKENENNPRFIRKERLDALAKSLKEFPKMMSLRPLIVDEDNVIIAGNMRYRALKMLGYKEIPSEWVKRIDDLSLEEKKRLIITDNNQFGEWDWDKLANEWELEFLKDIGLEIEGLDLNEEVEEVESYYTNENCIYPLIPKYDEKYTAFVIICETETEEAAIRTKFNFPEKARSYKKKFLGKTNVCYAKDILK